MAPFIRNTGVNTLNELFALKKNMAFQAKLEHRLSSMSKDFQSQSENRRDIINSTHNEIKDIRLSTGYNLDQVRSATSRYKNIHKLKPTVYVPPLGVRLLQKYTGLDVQYGHRKGKKDETSSRNETEKSKNQLKGNLKKSGTTLPPLANRNGNAMVSIDNGETKDRPRKSAMKQSTPFDMKPIHIEEEPTQLERNMSSEYMVRNEAHLEDMMPFKMSPTETGEVVDLDLRCPPDENGFETSKRPQDGEIEDGKQKKTPSKQEQAAMNQRIIKTMTPIGRSNLSASSRVQIGGSSSVYEKRSKFYLDYGNGDLRIHDMMEIPKIRDCARCWCSVTCKTCKLRTTQMPCFLLVPHEKPPTSKLPKDNRRPSLFPLYQGPKKATDANSDTDSSSDIGIDAEKNNTRKKSSSKRKSVITPGAETVHSENSYFFDEKWHKMEADIQEYVKRNNAMRRGYSKRRIEELAQPKHGNAPLVKFSKRSLRREFEMLREQERMKPLSDAEKGKSDHYSREDNCVSCASTPTGN